MHFYEGVGMDISLEEVFVEDLEELEVELDFGEGACVEKDMVKGAGIE